MPKVYSPLPPLELLQRRLTYNAETGEFTWRENRRRARAGSPAGRINAIGYHEIGINGKLYQAHRIAWFFVTQKDPVSSEIDHINGKPWDNRACNLRLATRSQQLCNTSTRSDNCSGHKGVHWDARKRKWKVQIQVQGKRSFVGYFDRIEDAIAARRKAELELHGEYSAHVCRSASQATPNRRSQTRRKPDQPAAHAGAHLP